MLSERGASGETAQGAMLGGLSPLRFRCASETAAEELRQAILSGTLKPGDRLIEQKLAATLGIGQPTLREALKELEHEGFVRKVPKKGTCVTKLSDEDICRIFEVRMALEALAVQKAAPNVTEAAATELEEIVKAMESAASKFDLAAYHKSDMAFHRNLWHLSGNDYLRLALDPIVVRLFAFSLLRRKPGATKEFQAAIEEHRQILEGLRTRNPDVARRAFVESTLRFWREHHRVDIAETNLV